MTPDERWNAESAAEIVALASDADTGNPDHIVILDTFSEVAQDLDKHLARAVAVRLMNLADMLPEPPRILRRDPDADDHLQALGDV